MDEVAEIQSRLDVLDQHISDLAETVRSHQQTDHVTPQLSASVVLSDPNVTTPIFHVSPESLAAAQVAAPTSHSLLSSFDTQVRDNLMDIPISHSTTTGSLLRSGPVRALLGDYPPDIFLHIEISRPLPEPLNFQATPLDCAKLPDLDRSRSESLIQSFIDRVHHYHPILSPSEIWRINGMVMDCGLDTGLSSSLLLTVLALGEVARDRPSSHSDPWMPGIDLLRPALGILMTKALSSFGNDLMLPQTLYLAGLYYSYLSRPLQAWRLVHMASTDVQHYWTR